MFLTDLPVAIWLVASVLATVGAVGCLAKAPPRGRLIGLYAFLALYLVFSGVYAVAHRLTGKGIDISVVYHLQTGLQGTGWLDFLPVLAGALLWLGLSALLPAWLVRRMRRQDALPVDSLVQRGRGAFLSLALLGAGWAAHPGVHDLGQLGLAFWRPASPIHDPLFSVVSPEAVLRPARPRDLVWIYLESLERGYLDEARFPGLTPQLRALEAQAMSFTQIQQVEGTGWTIAGMVASQCGVPLLDLADGNALTGGDRFMSQATCLGDYLSQQGHQMHYRGGASLVFAGKGAFYRTHGFEAQGLDEIRHQLPPALPTTGWGLYDDTLYAHVWQDLLTQANEEAPLGMFMLTLDTHHPRGHASGACRDLPYGDARNPMLNAVHCADMLVGRFVRQLQQHPRLKDALVVISSDHLAMPNTATQQLDQGPRHNLLMLLGANLPPQKIDRQGTTLDSAPTVLQRMGLDVPALGYGRDLLGQAPTLAESLGDGTDDFLLGRISALRQLWHHPDLSQGLQWLPEHMQVDGRQLPLPLLLQIDANHHISSVAYPSGRSLADMVQALPPEQSLLWVDQCALLEPLNGQSTDTSGLCMATGQAGSRWDVSAIQTGERVSFDAIRQSLVKSQQQPVDADLQTTRTQQTSNWIEWGVATIDHVVSVKGLGQRMLLHSSGRSDVASYANAQTRTDWLSRGVSLLQLPPSGALKKLAYRDTCAPAPDPAALHGAKDPLTGAVKKVLQRAGPGLFMLLAHDSAVCGPSVLPAWVQGTALHQAAQLGFRQPYIGLRLPDGAVQEYSAPSGQSLTIALQPAQP